MKRHTYQTILIWVVLMFAGALYISGCSGIDAPAVAGAPQVGGDSQAGGGIGAPSGTQDFSDEDLSGGGRINPSSLQTATPFQAAQTHNEINLPAISPGDIIERGSVRFQLLQVKLENNQTTVAYEVSGLTADFQPAPEAGAEALLLADGTRLAAGASSGGNSADSETSAVIFPALPAGTRSLTLLVTNNWTGPLETWKIPIQLP